MVSMKDWQLIRRHESEIEDDNYRVYLFVGDIPTTGDNYYNFKLQITGDEDEEEYGIKPLLTFNYIQRGMDLYSYHSTPEILYQYENRSSIIRKITIPVGDSDAPFMFESVATEAFNIVAGTELNELCKEEVGSFEIYDWINGLDGDNEITLTLGRREW